MTTFLVVVVAQGCDYAPTKGQVAEVDMFVTDRLGSKVERRRSLWGVGEVTAQGLVFWTRVLIGSAKLLVMGN